MRRRRKKGRRRKKKKKKKKRMKKRKTKEEKRRIANSETNCHKINEYMKVYIYIFLRMSHGFDSVTEIFAKRRESFLNKIRFTNNPVLVTLKALSI